jgi:uncharacterized protein involved in outer membrane biogenesis
MTSTTPAPTPRRKRRRWPFVLLFLVALPFLLLWIVSTPAFLQAVVLPQIEKASGMTLEVGDIALSPLSSLELRDVKAFRPDGTLHAEIPLAEARYDLLALLKGTLRVEKLHLKDAQIVLQQLAAAPSPTNPAPSSPPPSADRPAPVATPAPVASAPKKPLHLDIGEVLLENLDLRFVEAEREVRVHALTIRIAEYSSGKPLIGQLRASLDLIQTQPDASGRLLATLSADLNTSLSPEFLPQNLRATVLGSELKTEGVFAAADDVASFRLDADLTPSEVKQVALSFQNREGQALGRLSISGPLDLQTQDADLRLEIADIGPAVLNLLGAPAGLSFGRSALAAQMRLLLQERGQKLQLSGEFQGQQFSLNRKGKQTPEIALTFRPALDLDLATKSLNIETLELRAEQSGRPLVSLLLRQPARFTWENEFSIRDDIDLTLNLSPVEVSEWMLDENAPLRSGRIQSNVQILAQDQGRSVQLLAQGRVMRLVLNVEGLQSTPLSAGLNSNLQVKNLENGNVTLNGDVRLDALSGKIQNIDLAPWTLALKGLVEKNPQHLEISSLGLQLAHSGTPVVDAQAQGRIPDQGSDTVLRVELRQGDLAKLASLLPDNPQLAGKLQGMLHVVSEDNKRFVLRSDASLSGFTLPGQRPSPSPLQIQLTGDSDLVSADIRSLQISWPPSATARNLLRLDGQANWENPKALRGSIRLRGDSADLSPWIPLPGVSTAARTSSPARTPAASEPSSRPTTPTVARRNEPTTATVAPEPAPIRLPVQSFKVDVDIGSLRLHQNQIDQLRLLAEVTHDAIRIPQLNLRLDSAPIDVKGEIQLQKPGFEYNLQASVAPLEVRELVNNWVPDMRGKVQGILSSDLSLRGAGLTGPSLRKNLKGSFRLDVRDGQIVILDEAELKNEGLLSLRRLLGGVMGTVATALGLEPHELMRPPLTELRIDAQLGDSRLTLSDFLAVNPEIHVGTRGEILLEDDLPASRIRKMPITLGVSTNVAKRARIYRIDRVREDRVFLPPFVSVEGTLGQPKINWDKSVITGLVLTGVTENIRLKDERAQQVLEGLGGLLSGEGPPPPRPTPTPSAAPPPGAVPTPTPKPSRTDRVLQGLDLIRELRSTPKPTP